MTVPPPDCIKLFKNLLEVKVLHVPFEDSRLLVCLAEASAEREGGKKNFVLWDEEKFSPLLGIADELLFAPPLWNFGGPFTIKA